MKKHILNSTASYPGGMSPQHRVFKIKTGPYAGRLAVLMPASASEIKLSWSDYPYASWSTPELIVDDAADYPFDAFMYDDGTLYLVYTLGSNGNLVFRKLTFSGGSWSVGDIVTLYDADENYYPSICLESPNRLWVAWGRYASEEYNINAKYSDDWGVNWAGGSSNPGDTILSGASSAYVKLITLEQYVYAVYSHDGNALSYRRKHFQLTLWETENDIATGSDFDENIDAARSQDGRLGVVFENGYIRFREFDGESWGGIIVIDDDGGEFPQIKYSRNIPFVVYLSDIGDDMHNILYSRRAGDAFSVPDVLAPEKNCFDKVFCYDASAAGYEDMTSAAASDSTGDIFHTDSSAIFKDAGDALYLGLDNKFHYLKLLLSASGAGGEVSWQYYDGQEWINFVPSGGSWDFSNQDKSLLLWDDMEAVPPEWQKCTVNGSELFWIKVAVVSPFTTGPVGTQVSSIPDVKAIVLMER